MNDLVLKIKDNKENEVPLFINLSCRGFLIDKSLSKRKSTTEDESSYTKPLSRGSEFGHLYFRKQCFSCEKVRFTDKKHPIRDIFGKVGTRDPKTHMKTLELCESRNHSYAKISKKHLLNVSDLVAMEARYQLSCRPSFEKPLPRYLSKGRSFSTKENKVFGSICAILEEEMELQTLSRLQSMMEKQYEDIYLTI